MILLIDNYDSFTFNLVQYLGELGAEPKVYRNDAISCEQAMRMDPDAIVLSPGPCDPDKAGICLELVLSAARAQLPLFGVCLGHQAIGQAFGGKIVQCHEIIHGKISKIHHNNDFLFADLLNPFSATRYHSLTIARDSLPDELEMTAWTADGVIMGIKHKSLPIYGVQFHPESIETKDGHAILRQFLQTVRGWDA